MSSVACPVPPPLDKQKMLDQIARNQRAGMDLNQARRQAARDLGITYKDLYYTAVRGQAPRGAARMAAPKGKTATVARQQQATTTRSWDVLQIERALPDRYDLDDIARFAQRNNLNLDDVMAVMMRERLEVSAPVVRTAPKVSTTKQDLTRRNAMLSDDELRSVRDYTFGIYDEATFDSPDGSGMIFGALNQSLRSGSVPSDPRLRNVMQGLDSAIDKSTNTSQYTVYRGLDFTYARPGDEAAMLRKLTPGRTVTDPGFMSTSLDQSVTQDFTERGILMEITVNPGNKALVLGRGVNEGTMGYEQREVLLPRNSTLRITSKEQVAGRWLIKAVLT